MRVALVEDDEDLNLLYAVLLQQQGYEVFSYFSGGDFAAAVEKDVDGFDLVLSDFKLPDMDGLEIFSAVRRMGLESPFMLVTAYGDFEIAVKALKAGVADYVVKPVEPGVLVSKVASYLDRRSLEEEVLFNRLGSKVIAKSPAMLTILKKLSRFARSRASILLTGESGVGKEVLARAVHSISQRREGSFVAVNASAIPDSLFEAEFFGYRKGAFTDAYRDHEGYARLADQGTLFLDEAGELSSPSQAKLLRLLEERVVQPLGAKESHQVDFRVISATNRNLGRSIEEGRFRQDLFYRLAVISIEIPPLQDRPEDIIPLARHLLQELATEEELNVTDFTPRAREALLAYRWPGNVRELKNRIYEAMLATDEPWVEAYHLNLPGEDADGKRPLSYDVAKKSFESRYVTRLLKIAGGKVNRVAELSGLSRKAVYDLMKRHGISPETFRNR